MRLTAPAHSACTVLPVLNIDIVYLVIDLLSDDFLSLKNCALVCHSWTGRARSHLFSSISLSVPGYGDNDVSPMVLNMFQKDPHTAGSVRSVSLLGRPCPLYYPSLQDVRRVFHFPLHPNIRVLHLSNFTTVGFLELFHIMQPLSRLEEFTVDNPVISSWDVERPPVRKPLNMPALKALHWSDDDLVDPVRGDDDLVPEHTALVDALCAAGILSRLESLHLRTTPPCFCQWTPKFSLMSRSLQRCAVCIPVIEEKDTNAERILQLREQTTAAYKSLVALTALRSLTIYVDAYARSPLTCLAASPTFYLDALTALLSLASLSEPFNHLSTLTFHIHRNVEHFTHSEAAWTALAHAFVGHPAESNSASLHAEVPSPARLEVRVKEVWRIIDEDGSAPDMTVREAQVRKLMDPFAEAGVEVDVSVEESEHDLYVSGWLD